MRQTMLLLAVGVAVAGCEPPPTTASGRPEATISNVDTACVRANLMGRMVNDGWTIRQSTDYMLVGARPTRNMGAAVLLSTRMSGPPEERLMLTMIPVGENGLRVVVQGAYVSNAGTAFEQHTPVTGTQSDVGKMEYGMQAVAAQCPVKVVAPPSTPPAKNTGARKT